MSLCFKYTTKLPIPQDSVGVFRLFIKLKFTNSHRCRVYGFDEEEKDAGSIYDMLPLKRSAPLSSRRMKYLTFSADDACISKLKCRHFSMCASSLFICLLVCFQEWDILLVCRKPVLPAPRSHFIAAEEGFLRTTRAAASKLHNTEWPKRMKSAFSPFYNPLWH